MSPASRLGVAMANVPTGVTVVSTRAADGAPIGATISSVTAVSQDPPMLSVALPADSEALAGIHASGTFTVNVLAEHQRPISARFALHRGPAQVTGLELVGEDDESPRLEGALAHLLCRVDRTVDVGDHELVIAEVVDLIEESGPSRPLLRFRGRYSTLGEEERQAQKQDPGGPSVRTGGLRAPARAPLVAIVGGGFSGAMTAAQLLRRRHPGGLRIVIVDRDHPIGRGVAYSTRSLEHRLNVPAAQMTALPDDLGHFLTWARERDPSITAEAFLPRAMFGDYVESVLAEAEAGAAGDVQLDRVVDEVLTVGPAHQPEPKMSLKLRSGAELLADRVVIASGSPAAADPSYADAELLASERWFGDPWEPAIHRTRVDGPTLLLGTGLTMVDQALVLGAAPEPAPLIAVSRTGLLPRRHLRSPAPAELREVRGDEEDSVRGVVARLLTEAAVAGDTGGDWRDAVDALRPATNRIWQVLSLEERRWFKQNLSRLWEVHRHRMAPQVAARLDVMRRRGDLRLLGAAVERMSLDGDGVEVALRHRVSGSEEALRVARVINCTGPAGDLNEVADPMVQSLLGAGLARVEPLGIGFEVAEDGALIDGEGRASARIFVIGPLRKGSLWETTAVPELRCQADEVADRITRLAHASSPAGSRPVAAGAV
jgi:uncharacterized NAD(P)/FAD-binding protein YdhS/flavin reductase (DIM6/NTAB) family NADH-FMN oxidoreductase RutF